jgi:hypothetical protein
MAARVVKGKDSDVARESLIENLDSFFGLLNHLLSIPPTFIAFTTTILDDFHSIDLLLLLFIKIGELAYCSIEKITYHNTFALRLVF